MIVALDMTAWDMIGPFRTHRDVQSGRKLEKNLAKRSSSLATDIHIKVTRTQMVDSLESRKDEDEQSRLRRSEEGDGSLNVSLEESGDDETLQTAVSGGWR